MNFEKFILIFRDLIDKFLYIFAISHLKSTQIIIPDPISDPWSGWLGAFVSAFVGSGLSAIVAFYIAKWVANHTISKTLKAERDKDFRAQKAENLSKLEKVALKIFYRGYIYFNSELYGQIKDIVTFSKDSSEIFSFIFQLTRMQGVKNDAFLEAIMEWSILKEQLKTDDSIFWNSAIKLIDCEFIEKIQEIDKRRMESFKEFKDFALKLKLEDPSTDRLRIHLDADGFLVKLNPFTSEIKLVRQDFEKKLNTQFEILRPLISSMQAPD